MTSDGTMDRRSIWPEHRREQPSQPGGRRGRPRDPHRLRALVSGFEEITRRARERFERRDWRGAQADATARLALYRIHLDAAVADVRDILEDAVLERTLWAAVKARHSEGLAGRPDAELAQTFFNSVTRRIFSTVGADPAIEYLDPAPAAAPMRTPSARSIADGSAPRWTAALVRAVLESYAGRCHTPSSTRDAERWPRSSASGWRERGGQGPVTVEMLRPVFYRNKGAYLVGRVRRGDLVLPLVLPLLNAERGIVVDAVLHDRERGQRRLRLQLVVLPGGGAAAAGDGGLPPLHHAAQAGGRALHRDRLQQARQDRAVSQPDAPSWSEPEARFAFAEGDEGMVMAVFTLPSFNVVFKIIKDSFGAPKNTTRQAVMDKYHFVFVRDRVGRLADAQEFEHLEFPRRCFPDDLLEYLLAVGGSDGAGGGRSGDRPAALHRAAGHARSTCSCATRSEAAAARRCSTTATRSRTSPRRTSSPATCC